MFVIKCSSFQLYCSVGRHQSVIFLRNVLISVSDFIAVGQRVSKNNKVGTLETNVGVRLAPSIGEGMRVRIRAGALEGLEGWVEQRYGMSTVLLRLDFINQAAAVKLEADLLEPI